MEAFIHYSTPPGWQERPMLPTLRRAHSRPGPALRQSGPPRPQPAARIGRRPAPEPEPRSDEFAALGLR